MSKKAIDPIQNVIIKENILAITGVSIPIITSIINYKTGLG